MEFNEPLNTIPRIGDMAPDFAATTTQGPLKFSEYNKGSWVIFFSHPADFTPVCTTELTLFAQEEENFKKLNTKLLGLSIDSIHSHIAWINNVKKNLDVTMRFPLIADIDMKVSKLYGMLQPGESETAAVRAVFFIDPTGKIRLIMYYPLNVGRNMDEIIRVLNALQATDVHKLACPVNWKPGAKFIVPPPKTVKDMEEREKSNYEMVDFYLARTSV